MTDLPTESQLVKRSEWWVETIYRTDGVIAYGPMSYADAQHLYDAITVDRHSYQSIKKVRMVREDSTFTCTLSAEF